MNSTTLLKRAAFAIPVLILLAVFILRYAPLILAGVISIQVLRMFLIILIAFLYFFIKILRSIE